MQNPVREALDAIVSKWDSENLPLSALWLDADGIGRMLSLTGKEVRQRIATRADFPKPLRIGGVGRPRWNALEVQQWAEAERERFAA